MNGTDKGEMLKVLEDGVYDINLRKKRGRKVEKRVDRVARGACRKNVKSVRRKRYCDNKGMRRNRE